MKICAVSGMLAAFFISVGDFPIIMIRRHFPVIM